MNARRCPQKLQVLLDAGYDDLESVCSKGEAEIRGGMGKEGRLWFSVVQCSWRHHCTKGGFQWVSRFSMILLQVRKLMEKIPSVQTVEWKNYLAAVQGVARSTENPLSYKSSACTGVV